MRRLVGMMGESGLERPCDVQQRYYEARINQKDGSKP